MRNNEKRWKTMRNNEKRWETMRMSNLASFHPRLFKNIAHVGYYLYFVFVFVFVFVSVFVFDFVYSLLRLVWPNTEEPYSRPFLGLSKIRLVLQGHMSPKNDRKNLPLFQVLLHSQLQQNALFQWCWLQDFQMDFSFWGPKVFVKEQILVNKSDKSDHPHQWKPWCLAEVVNEVKAGTTPNFF